MTTEKLFRASAAYRLNPSIPKLIKKAATFKKVADRFFYIGLFLLVIAALIGPSLLQIGNLSKIVWVVFIVICVCGALATLIGIWVFFGLTKIPYANLIAETNDLAQRYFGFPDHSDDFYLLAEENLREMAENKLKDFAIELFNVDARILIELQDPQTYVAFVGEVLAERLRSRAERRIKTYGKFKCALNDFKRLGFIKREIKATELYDSLRLQHLASLK